MKQHPFPKGRFWPAAFGAVLFALLLLNRDTLICSLCLGFYPSQLATLAVMVLTGLAFLTVNRHHLREILTDKRMLLMAVPLALFLLVMLFKRDWQMMYLSIAVCPVFAVFLTYFTDSRRVAKTYLVILAVLSAYSLLATYGMRHLAWGDVVKPGIRVNQAGMWFYDFGLCFAGTDRFWHRNFGLFREPGVYQYFLILGLYLNHYGAAWDKPWKTWTISAILALTMVSTFSVPGMIELVVFAVFLFFDKGYHRTKQGRRALLALLAGLAAIALVVLYLLKTKRILYGNSILFEFGDIVTRLTTDSESLVDRINAYFTDLRFFARNPLLGEKFHPVLHGTNHNTTSTLVLFAATGIFGGGLSVAVWVKMLWDKNRKIIGNLILLGILFLSFNTQNLVADLFFWLFPCMVFTEKVLPKLTKEEG